MQTEGATKEKSDVVQAAAVTASKEPQLPLKGKMIVLDPGHGGKDVGSIGGAGTYEKEVTLQTAQHIGRKLTEQGATVVMTRQADTTISLKGRTEVAQTAHADLFISIHYDAFQSSDVYGMTTYYNKPQDREIARIIHDKLFRQDIQTKDRGVQFGDYHVIRENATPAVLLELGYISNEDEEARMKTESFQEQIATAIVNGVIEGLR
ncbi:N-acetylmuramoyl-L-alanine amidase [Paenibacillus montanisoli]|uniref:N-acetylmuramoyl-L-alanine amidase n=2 Tax=Paenibacillus montanisoli TaxID=2081970 RepID=A0A328U2M0_9BACL|nr:N-acetylmuramoyl-L-alanine amidase [Paenibacillus montanisoli]